MSGNFVRERQRIVYIYNIHFVYVYIIHVNNTLPLAHEISRHFWAAYGSNLHCKNCSAFIEKEFIPVAFLSYTCNYYNRLYLIVSTNFAISWFTDFIGSFVVSELSV